MITLGDIASWIIINRKRTSFKNFTYQQLVMYLSEKSNNDELLIVLDGECIAGVVCYTPTGSSELFIDDILTNKMGAVKQMLKVCNQKFPDRRITGTHRTGRKRNFDQDKLTRRM